MAVPACKQYGQKNGLTYSEIKLTQMHGNNDSVVVYCAFKNAEGQKEEMTFFDVTPFFIYLLVDLARDPYIPTLGICWFACRGARAIVSARLGMALTDCRG